MDIHQLSKKVSELITELEQAFEKGKKGILKIEDAQELITSVRKELSELLTEGSDPYELYNRYKLENTLWWNDKGHGYAEKSDLSNVENEIEQLRIILKVINPDLIEEDTTSANEYHFKKGDFSGPPATIFNIMKTAKKSIMIIDSYLDESIFDYIKSLDKSVSFKILTTGKELKPIIPKIAEQCLKEDWNITLKGSEEFHDRYIIIDDEIVWHVGYSIKDLGRKESTISKINQKSELDKIFESIEHAWQDSITHVDGISMDIVDWRVDIGIPFKILDEDEDTAKLNAQEQCNKWIKNIKKKYDDDIVSYSESDDEYVVEISDKPGNAVLNLNWNSKQYDGTSYFIIASLSIHTSNKAMLDSIIKLLKCSYWALYYTLKNNLELQHILEDIEKSTGDPLWVGGYKKNKVGEEIPQILEYRHSSSILIQLHANGRMIISLLKGPFDKGFKKLYELITPNKIMSILYGEYSPKQLKKLLDKIR